MMVVVSRTVVHADDVLHRGVRGMERLIVLVLGVGIIPKLMLSYGLARASHGEVLLFFLFWSEACIAQLVVYYL